MAGLRNQMRVWQLAVLGSHPVQDTIDKDRWIGYAARPRSDGGAYCEKYLSDELIWGQAMTSGKRREMIQVCGWKG